jgi:hypothetical protein
VLSHVAMSLTFTNPVMRGYQPKLSINPVEILRYINVHPLIHFYIVHITVKLSTRWSNATISFDIKIQYDLVRFRYLEEKYGSSTSLLVAMKCSLRCM